MKRFPILRNFGDREVRRRLEELCPESIDWIFVEPHRRQAEINHCQRLETLAKRGGLDPSEMVAVLEDRPYRVMELGLAITRLRQLIGWENP